LFPSDSDSTTLYPLDSFSTSHSMA
jgi:hypothetical protein